MRKQQDATDNELEMKWTLTYVVYIANTYKIWGGNHNNTPILASISSWNYSGNIRSPTTYNATSFFVRLMTIFSCNVKTMKKSS